MNVESRKPRILYFEGEPRWEYKFIRRALDDYPNIEIAAMLRTTQNKIYRQLPTTWARRSWKTASPPRPRTCSGYQGMIIGTVGGQLLHAHAAAADPRFRGPARRRRAVPGRPRLALRWRLRQTRRWPI